MGRAFEQLAELRDEGMDYLRLRWADIRLGVTEKLSVGLSKAFGWAIFIVLALAAVSFLMVALALWLGELLGHYSYGFLIAGGGLLLLAVLMLLIGKRIFANSMVRHFIDMFFTDSDDYYGQGR